jgi:hypothetical protein
MKTTEKKNIIIKDRVEIYYDFTKNLLKYIFKYYIDRESLSEYQDMKNHFNWCFNKVCDEFLEEEINFIKNNELREYFFTYYYNQFYNVSQNNNLVKEYYEFFWDEIFNIKNVKNSNYIKILFEIYNIFDTSINTNKNILEMV